MNEDNREGIPFKKNQKGKLKTSVVGEEKPETASCWDEREVAITSRWWDQREKREGGKILGGPSCSGPPDAASGVRRTHERQWDCARLELGLTARCAYLPQAQALMRCTYSIVEPPGLSRADEIQGIAETRLGIQSAQPAGPFSRQLFSSHRATRTSAAAVIQQDRPFMQTIQAMSARLEVWKYKH